MMQISAGSPFNDGPLLLGQPLQAKAAVIAAFEYQL
jgi:hypothetical protein